MTTLMSLAAFFPDRQTAERVACQCHYYRLNTVTHSYTLRLQLTSPVYSEYTTLRPDRFYVALLGNSTGCPLCAGWSSIRLYSLTKPRTTTRQCIYVNSCARINRPEHCALRTITCLEVKRTRTKAGDCPFVVAAASLWNNLPTVIKICDNLTSFKRLLKTHFFCFAY